MKAKLSVVVPVFNVEKYLPRCLDSIVGQTMRDIEIILVDDGSSDNSGKICDDYAAKDPRARVIRRNHSGAGAARNAGMKIAGADYVGFVDSDDWADAGFFESLCGRADTTGAEIVKGEVMTTENGTTYLKNPYHADIRWNRGRFTNGCFWSAIYSRDFLLGNKIDFPENIVTGQDVVFLNKAVILANKIDLARGGNYYHYMRRNDSLDSWPLDDVKIKSKIDAILMISDFMNRTDFYAETYTAIFEFWMGHMIGNLFHRAETRFGENYVAQAAINMYKECRYPFDYPQFRTLLAGKSRDEVYAVLKKNKKN
jgi:glycosyltransferase involved in cell wall biosynthesis